MTDFILISDLRRPACGAIHAGTMPTDACTIRFPCPCGHDPTKSRRLLRVLLLWQRAVPADPRSAAHGRERLLRMTDDQRPLIVLATPCFGGLVHQAYMLSVCKLTQAAPAQKFDLELVLLGGDALISRARSVLASRFLDMPRATHLLFVDADIAFEPDQVLRLLRFDKEFVAAFYPLKAVDWSAIPARVVVGEALSSAGLSYVGRLLDEPERRTDGDFATALYAGTGFQLIKRAVFERLIDAHPELRFKRVHAQAGGVPASDNLYALFDCFIDPDTGV